MGPSKSFWRASCEDDWRKIDQGPRTRGWAVSESREVATA